MGVGAIAFLRLDRGIQSLILHNLSFPPLLNTCMGKLRQESGALSAVFSLNLPAQSFFI